MKLKIFSLSLIFCAGLMSAQTYQVPVTEDDEPMMQGQFRPTWESLSSYQVPEWFRNAKILPHGRRFGNNSARQTAEPDFSDIQDYCCPINSIKYKNVVLGHCVFSGRVLFCNSKPRQKIDNW